MSEPPEGFCILSSGFPTIEEMDSLGLYISVPFCRSKCTYCNFASGVFPTSYFDRYVDRLEEDLRGMPAEAALWDVRPPERVDSIYLGGGTPSLLPAALVIRLFAAVRRELVVHADAEITVECAPCQLEDETLAAMAECGVNRVSFGVQSFIDEEAKHAGRLHTREIVLRDVERVRQAGIMRVNLDLIAGLPGQTRASWCESLEVLCGVMPDHASIYMLEVDDDSRLGREISSGGLKYYAPHVPADDAIAEMYVEASEFLDTNHLPQYEISNFAARGAESRHNLKYWQRQPYLGLGLDAHSMLRDADDQALRFATTDQLEPFLNAAGWTQPQRLAREEELEEAWFLGLRLNAGVSLTAMRAEFGEDAVGHFNSVLADLASSGLIEFDEDRVRLTLQGRLLSNEVFARFLVEPVNA
jgi:oxygen-independent coproporphyrinogen III oxidase